MVWSGFSKLANMGRQMGRGISSWATTNNDITDPDSQYTSTGNKFKDLGVGVIAGLGQINNRPYSYFPTYNYMGHGLARTSMSQLPNPFYNQYNDIANLIARRISKVKKAKGFTPDNSNYNAALKAEYTLPTSVNSYMQPGLYSNGIVYNPYRLTSPKYDDVINAKFSWQTGE